MKWRDVEIGDTVVCTTSRTVCTLLERNGRICKWFILDSDDFDPIQRPGTTYTVEATAHDEDIEDWLVLKGRGAMRHT